MPDIEAIPGIKELWAKTLGDRRVCIAVLDGPADLNHACFQGADLAPLESGWRRRTAEQDYIVHATHVASVIFGQHGSEVKGIAPGCRGLNVAVALDAETVQCPLELTRGIDAARDAGANIIHVAPCVATATGHADGLLARSIRACTENNILVVAPAGNDSGNCWCLPAALPDVLAVGALNDQGVPFQFSNWGGAYQRQGIVAPGENILGAEPGNLTRRRRGTSCSAPVVTGVAALMMSLQLQNEEAVNAGRIRDALLKSARACAAGDSAEPGRCLAGQLNVSGAVRLLVDPRYARYRQESAVRSARTAVRTGMIGTNGLAPGNVSRFSFR
jgi:cyanobactin maturation PatA/PatG family protease